MLVSNSAFTLLDDASGLRLLGAAGRRTPGQPVFVVQAFSGWERPPDVPGLELVEDRFTRDRPAVAGWTLSRNLPGYNYAVYLVRRPREAARVAELLSTKIPRR